MTQNGDDVTPARPSGTSELRLAATPAEQRPGGTAEPLEQGLPADHSQAILEATKRVGALLKREGHMFALAGSVAVYAHGGSGHLQHDADFCVRPEDAEAVAATLHGAGLTVYRVAHLLERLAAGHPGELGVRVEVRGEAVQLTGTVASAQSREEILGMVREELAGVPVHSDIVVAETSAPGQAEELA
ncbi:BON domain-containing protein [Streptomyces gibsoniae]|uniref:BON domain-containing protein n=1 Tax=Streptomyces gibsoniae TaxID=3075529 RepID=A0ABU2TT28_9ACTN|nr:BON domain-containing protein [Streptomyces sp. DSM 41699]MDT0464104.1 BON domain-containing protein [Streptomyces sp. DSM 41699]